MKLKRGKAITQIVTALHRKEKLPEVEIMQLPYKDLILCNTFGKNLILEIEVVDRNGKLMQNA
jgi:protocatechuate 3,4-dioxygenase beta subunit